MKVRAILCSDVHLSHNPPVARSGEESWYDAMARPLGELCVLKRKYNATILCAGDIFHHWRSPPQLINFALDCLPDMVMIPGQHDAPLHNLDLMDQSAYGTLSRDDRFTDISIDDMCEDLYDMEIRGFPWGYDPIPFEGERNNALQVALVHRYTWIAGHSFPGAPEDGFALTLANKMSGYDLVVTGDNHQRFTYQHPEGGPLIVNPGCLIPRAIDERELGSQVALWMEDGSIRRHDLDTSRDKWIDSNKEIKTSSKDEVLIRKFMAQLDVAGREVPDFAEAVRGYVRTHDVNLEVGRVLEEVLDCAE